MKCVILESPFRADTPDLKARNLFYARLAMKDSLGRGEAPFASHLLYTQIGILDDTVREERAKGISAGLAWGDLAEYVVIYIDLGISGGMIAAKEIYEELGLPIYSRNIHNWEELWSLEQ